MAFVVQEVERIRCDMRNASACNQLPYRESFPAFTAFAAVISLTYPRAKSKAAGTKILQTACSGAVESESRGADDCIGSAGFRRMKYSPRGFDDPARA